MAKTLAKKEKDEVRKCSSFIPHPSSFILFGYLLVFFAVLVFSTIEVASQYLQREQNVSVLDISLLRFGIGGIFLIIVALVRTPNFLFIIKKDVWKLALLGLLGTTTLSLCYHRSLMLTSSMIGGAIFSINPAIVALIFLISRVEKPSCPKIIGIMLGIACVYITNKGAQAHEPEFPEYLAGNLFMIAAVLAWSFYFFLVRDYIKKYSALVVSSIVVFSGSIGLMVAIPLLRFLGWSGSMTFYRILTPVGWVLICYLGVVTVGIGYYWLYTGLARTGVSNGMMLFFIKPGMVALLAYLLQHQPLSPLIWFGIILAAASIVIVGIKKNRS